MYICVILPQGQKILVPCERNTTSDTLKGLATRLVADMWMGHINRRVVYIRDGLWLLNVLTGFYGNATKIHFFHQ